MLGDATGLQVVRALAVQAWHELATACSTSESSWRDTLHRLTQLMVIAAISVSTGKALRRRVVLQNHASVDEDREAQGDLDWKSERGDVKHSEEH